MKRLFFAILILIFILTGCGQTAAEPTLSADELTLQEVDALIAAGEYEKAIDLLSSMESYRAVADRIARAEAEYAAQLQAKAESEYAARPRTEISITRENLETYFEFVPVPYFNTFGQLDLILGRLFLREEYADRVDFESPFQVDILYSAEGITASVTYEAGSFSYGAPPPTWGGAIMNDDTMHLSNETLRIITEYRQAELPDGTGISEGSSLPDIMDPMYMGVFWTDYVYHEGDVNVANDWTMDIQQVQGSIILFDE